MIVSANAHENTEEARATHGYFRFRQQAGARGGTDRGGPARWRARCGTSRAAAVHALPSAELLRELLLLGATGRRAEAQLSVAEGADAAAAWAVRDVALARSDGAALTHSLGEALHESRS
ncbi:hypothetical protein ACU4GD_19920 [Cupriavidus basilensis]